MNSQLAIHTIKESCYQVGYPTYDKEHERRTLINQSCDYAIECIDKLDKIKQIIADYDGSTVSMVKQFSEIQMANVWINAELKKPKEYEMVLCWYEYFRYGDYNRMYQTYGIGFYGDGFWGGEVAQGHKTRVLYWRPLPSPPKGAKC